MLIGPLAHIKNEVCGVIVYAIDFSCPGAKERFEADMKEFWTWHGEDYKNDP